MRNVFWKWLASGKDAWLARCDEAAVRRAFDRATASNRTAAFLLLGVCSLLYVPGISSIPPLDRDEPRYTQATRQMVETGDYTRMYFQEQFRNKKPVGIYWLQAASVHLFGGERVKDRIWPYRLPSLLCAFGTILLLYRLGCRLIGKPQSLLAALLLACAPLMNAVAHVATTDSALLLATTAAQYNLVQVYLANRERRAPRLANALLFWIAVGGGILIKGPITPLLALLTSVSLMVIDRDRRAFRGLRPLLGVPLMLAIVLPWLVSIQLATDGAFLRDSFGGDFGRKLVSGQESHGAPPGFYTLLMAVTCWPATLLAVPALVDAWRNRRSDPMAAIGVSWVLPYLVLIELVPTKLPHYILCACPPLMLLCARHAWQGTVPTLPTKFLKGLHWFYGRVWTLMLPLAALALCATAALGRNPWPALLAGGVLGVGAVVTSTLAGKGALCRLAGSIPAFAAGLFLTFGLVLPSLTALWVSQTVAEAFHEVREAQPGSRLYAVGYHEPSLVFLTETRTRLCRADAIDQEYGPDMVAFLTKDAAEKTHSPLIQIKPIEGINYSKGKRVEGALYVHPGSKALAALSEKGTNPREAPQRRP